MKILATIFLFFLSFSTLTAKEMRGFLTTEDIRLFFEQGYLLKRGCLSQEEINGLDKTTETLIKYALEEIQRSIDQTLSERDQFLYIAGSRVVFKRHLDDSISLARINGVSGMEPSLLETLRSEKMIYTFFELLNTSELEHLISQIHPKLPGDGIAYPKHRDIQFRQSYDPDWQDILGNGSYAICIIPVDPMNATNGGLWIDKNSYPKPQGIEEEHIWIDANPGDLLFMHPYLFHGSGPNLSSTSRRTLLTGFCAFGANHRPYPGADVNQQLVLKDDGSIETRHLSWSQKVTERTDANH